MDLLFHSTYPPIECGIATYTQYLTRALRTQGDRVWIAAPEGAQGSGVIPGLDGHSSETRQRLVEITRRLDVDLVHIQHEYGLFGDEHGLEAVPLVLKLALNEVPVVVTLHTVYDRLSLNQERILHPIMHASRGIVVHHDYQLQTLRDHFSPSLTGKVRVIPHGAREVKPVPDAREQLGYDPEDRLLLLIGYFRPSKNFEQVIRVFPRILERYPGARLIMASTIRKNEYTEYRRKLLSLIENSPARDRIDVINDEIPQDRFDTIVSASDVVALPYDVISQSGIMAHAFAFRKPVVASDSLATREILGTSRAGFVCREDDDYVENVCRLFNYPDLYHAKSTNAQRYVNETIGWSSVAEKHHVFYEELLREARGSTVEQPGTNQPRELFQRASV